MPRELRIAALAPLAGYLFGVLLHIDRLPLWCTGLALSASGWRAAATVRPELRLPGRGLRIVLALAVVVAVALEFRTLNGLAAGTALLTVMGALKLFEMQARRDRLIVIAVGFVLLLAACLDRQSLLRVPLYVAALYVGCTALALAATPRPGFGVLGASRLVGRSLASALPLTLLLFVFFPRIAGSFWALPNVDSALTGLGDEMTPGAIDALTESDEPAFRVRFEGPPPPPMQRYWRGPVLHSFDGTTWRRLSGQSLPHPPLEYPGDGFRYRISIEPQKHNWVFALEKPRAPADPALVFSFDDQLLATQPLSAVTDYEFTSFPAARNRGALPQALRALDTALRPGANPRALALGLELRAGVASDAALVDAVLDLFRTQGFEYTLTPPKLDRDAVDEFLFGTKRGFCGHFASAFVDLMRAGGVPAHVVTGYLGGEWNPLGGYYIIRQSDAHAWAEVWLEARGWTRVDPTAVVAPERLTRGLYDFMPGSMSTRERLLHDNAWITRGRLAWDATDNWWREHVQGYDLRRQLAFLERLGFEAPDARKLGLAMGVALAAWLLWIGWQSRRGVRPRARDALATAWGRFGARLAALGLARSPHEGPLDYAARVAVRRPDLARQVGALCARYAALRYGPPAAAGERRAAIEAFRRAVGKFRPARAAAATGSPPLRADP